MADSLPILVALLAALTLTSLLARRLRLPLPLLLAVAGFALAFLPHLSGARIDAELVLAGFLPPLLYADAFDTSWTDFRRWVRPILMLAVGLVVLTIAAVGWAVHTAAPELPWAVCFLVGAVVSPTDTVAVQSVLERLRIPRRTTAIIGGESLVNDATGLVGVQLCAAVVLTGAFEMAEIAGEFAKVAGAGLVVGIVIGAVFAFVNRLVRDHAVLFAISLVAPYLAYWLAQVAGGSGVLAVVISGFIVAWNIHNLHAEARVKLYDVWELMVFLLNGMCFLFIGLESARILVTQDEAMCGEMARIGLWASAAVVLARIAWCIPGAYLPLWLSPRLRAHEGGYPSWKGVTIVSWCGVRGAISLAAALALPLELGSLPSFGGASVRDVVTSITLVVIVATLFGQGLTLLPLVRVLGLRDDENTQSEVRGAREALLEAGIARLDEFCTEVSCPISVHHLRTQMADELVALRDADEDSRRAATARVAVSRDVRRAIAQAQERRLLSLRNGGRINDKTYVELMLELDRSNLDVHAAS